MKTCELLAPAGSMEKLKTAIHYGADAVYIGGREFSLRARAGNFSDAEIAEAVKFAHARGVKLYAAVNIFARNKDIKKAEGYLEHLAASNIDAFIISDPGILRMARKVAPHVPVHLSTQANTTNFYSALFWQELGIRRVNLARELSLQEIKEIRHASQIEIEVFVHGALCISYSGRCMLSLYLTGRDANRGNCAHPCRYQYRVEESRRPGEFFPVEEDEKGVYIFNSKDLCLARRLPELVDAGIDSIKIEGRMKGLYYVAGVVRAYRAALNLIRQKHEEGKKQIIIPEDIIRELKALGSRGYTENFFSSPPSHEDMLYQGPDIDQTWIPACTIQGCKNGRVHVKVCSIVRQGDRLEYMHRKPAQTGFVVREIADMDGSTIPQATGGMEVLMSVRTENDINWAEGALARRKPPDKTV